MAARALSIETLAVASYGARHATDEIRRWTGAYCIPRAESCSRHVIYGFADDFENFPHKEQAAVQNSGYHLMSGAEAYTFLLDVITGLKSERVAEAHIRHQFFDRWKKFAELHPVPAKDYRSFIAQIKADSTYVINQVLADYKIQRHEHAVRDLSGQKTGDRILIVPRPNDHGGLSSFVSSFLRVCESKQRDQRDFITLTHPDPAVLEAIKADIQKMERDNILRTGVVFHDFEEFPKDCETHDQVYISIGMGHDPDLDQSIIDCWKARSRTNNKLTHMKGSPENMGLSTPLWDGAGLDNYIAPEEIRMDMRHRGRWNAHVISSAEALNKRCAEIRLDGGVPSLILAEEKKLKDPPKYGELTLEG